MNLKKYYASKKMSKKHAKEQFELACTQPYLWLYKAEEIQMTADTLWGMYIEEITKVNNQLPFQYSILTFGRAAMMLYGMVIENLLKAGIIHKQLGGVRRKGKFNLRSHDLRDLANDLGLVLTEQSFLGFRIIYSGLFVILSLYMKRVYILKNLVTGIVGLITGASLLERWTIFIPLFGELGHFFRLWMRRVRSILKSLRRKKAIQAPACSLLRLRRFDHSEQRGGRLFLTVDDLIDS